MSGSLLEILTENEYRANRSCAIAGFLTSAVMLGLVAIGWTGAFYISRPWMVFYLLAIVLPMLAIAAYAKMRKFRGSEIKFLMIFGSALIPVCMSIPTVFGFFLMALPLVVSARYMSRKLVWETYAIVVLLSVAATIPHAALGHPIATVEAANARIFRAFLADGTFDRFAYGRGLLVWGLPSFVIGLGFFAIILCRICRDGLALFGYQAKVHARLADVEKGLAIAATMEIMKGSGEEFEHVVSGANQPEVGTWTTEAIVACIAKCKKRAADDPEFAALIERDPAAAVREVQE